MADEFYENNSYAVDSCGQFGGDTNIRPKPLKIHYISETEIKIKDLKLSLEKWREVILPINSILHWEKQWHPFGIIGCSTMLFMMIWLLEPSILTTLSLLGLTLTLCDHLVPILAETLLKPERWTDKQEEKYDRICRSIILSKEKISITCRSFYLMRTTRPKLYYGLSICVLLFLAWLGNNINNLFLTYLLITFLVLMPGMEQHGILQKYGCLLTDKIADLATNARLNVAEAKKEK